MGFDTLPVDSFRSWVASLLWDRFQELFGGISLYLSVSSVVAGDGGGCVADFDSVEGEEVPCDFVVEPPKVSSRRRGRPKKGDAGGLVPEEGVVSGSCPILQAPRPRGRPRKVKKGRKPRLLPSAPLAIVEGDGSSFIAAPPSICPAPLPPEKAPGGCYWTRVKAAWTVGKLLGCSFDGGDEAAIRD
ncbi:uncharacterized protein LOC130742532 [Lotus japonicus]|uniref:uncharacterized protein LOC130742532 n=1 Tax=Lotus japonicus TaxID=34305 RepID=UPI002590F5A2|nr:uncharacterized protein LOC130742532 [Lotus japonicus]